MSNDGELARLIRDLDELVPDGPEQDADVLATEELRRRLQGHGAPLVLSAGLEERLKAMADDVPAALWTIHEPDTVAQCHALSVASGADVTVANTLEPLAALIADEGVDAGWLLRTGASLATRSAAPFAVGAINVAGLDDVAVNDLAGVALETPGLGLPGLLLLGAETPADVARVLAVLGSWDAPVIVLPSPSGWDACSDAKAWLVDPRVAALGAEGPLNEALTLTERDAAAARDAGMGWVVRADVTDAAPEQCALAAKRLYDAGATAVGWTGAVTPAHTQALREACDEV